MSERGSFVTDYMYCEKCFEAAKGVLLSHDKWLCSTTIPHWSAESNSKEMPIIAGKIGDSWSEAFSMEHEIGPELAKVICHPVRIAVLEDRGRRDSKEARTIVVMPAGNNERQQPKE